MSDGLAPLALHFEPMQDAPRLPSGEWLQDAQYPEPLWTNTVPELARRVSVGNLRGLYALQLLPRWDPEPRAAELLALAGWTKRTEYYVALAESQRPIEEGFLRRLRFWRDDSAPAQPVPVAEVFGVFAKSENARIGHDLEPWLRAKYGARRPDGEVFAWIDYPGFDCGTMTIGFAILVHGDELHIWSRAAHAHK